MEILKYDLKTKVYIPDILKDNIDATNFCFLDIETTGLSSKYNNIILIGMLCIENNNIYITQFFAQNTSEEKQLLMTFVSLLNNFEHIITYNGSTFDIPFIKSRLDYYNIDTNISQINHVDLLKVVRKNKSVLGLSDCKLKTVEKLLGIFREDTISGKESVDLYKKYTIFKDQHIKDIILKHNYDDIFYLPKLLTIYDIVNIKNTLNIELKFQEIVIDLSIDKTFLSFKNGILSIVGKTKIANLPPQLYYQESHSLDWNIPIGSFNLSIQYKVGRLATGQQCYYIDLSETDIYLEAVDNILLLNVDKEVIYDNISALVKGIVNAIY